MAKTVSFIYCTYLLTTLMYHFSRGEIESTINHCCSLGNSIALRDQHCNGISISTPVRGVAPETQSVCFSAMQLCCVHDLRTLQCEEGKEAARLGRSCPNDNTDRKLCCEACKLGIISASMRVDCISEDINFGCPWNSAFAACCSAHDYQTLDNNNYTAVQSNDHQVVADHNICDLYPGELCAHICVPMLSSYICRCHEGFTLMADGKTCNQNVENRCITNNPCQHKCQDTGVSIECTCDKGYRLHSNKTSCIDIDECAEDLHYCSPYETCHNEPGRFSCEQIKDIEVPSTTGTDSTTLSTPLYNDTKGCPFGYAMNRELRKCVDVNECQENIHVCQTETEECVNIQGGYNCVKKQIKKPVQHQQCNTGFHWDSSAGTCLDINECEDVSGDSPCDSNQICENIVGSYRCLCKTGYQLDSLTQACVDINECQVDLHNCLPSQRCDNTIGSFQCVRYTNCGTGYTLNAQTGICEDDDECALKIDNCRYLGSDFICRNTLGSFRCEKQGKENCDGKCASQKNFTQKCPRGYQPNANGQCEDINECEKGLARCGQNQRCINIQGAYTCSSALNCESGLRINEGRTQCVDIDECAEQQRICDHSCINLWGSYRCSCRSGYKLHEDNRTCVDINECEIYKDRRLCMGYCVNQPGSHSCQCPQGYILGNDLSSCIDIDECKDGKVCKGQDQACLNMRGSYRCNSIACPPGYIKDSAHENKCKKASTGCREDDAECIQQPLAYTFYFIALVSNYSIPPGGLDFFTMRGPLRASTSVDFGLNLKSAQTPPGVPPATKDYFDLPHTGHNQVSIKLMQSLLGPQDITLELTMTFYFSGIFGGKTVSRIGLFVSQYEF